MELMHKNLTLTMILLGGLALSLSSCDTVTEPSATFEAQGNWHLQSFALADGSTLQVPNPENYTIQFGADGSLSVRADCNRCNGSYESPLGTNLQIGLLACTLAHCGPESLDFRYTSALGSASSFRRMGDELALTYDGGTMVFLVSP
jgi:heat shock protein HslJ